MSSREDLRERVSTLVALRDSQEGAIPTAVDGLLVIQQRQPTSFIPSLYNPVLCTILQGSKETRTTETSVSLQAGDALVVSHRLPVVARVTVASPQKPYLALVSSIDLAVVRSLYSELGNDHAPVGEEASLQVGQGDDRLFSVLLRLIELTERPSDMPVMAPMLMRELHFRLLSAQYGATLRSLLDTSSYASRIERAIELVRSRTSSTLTVQEMAKAAAMSESTFYEHFKRVTSTTPLQYQKDYRLLEAQRLIREQGIPVSEVALRVGYESNSQFSREYSRKFGNPPRDDLGRDQYGNRGDSV